MRRLRILLISVTILWTALLAGNFFEVTEATGASPEYSWVAQPLFELSAEPFALNPTGLSPAQIRSAYNLPSTGGNGSTIAIVTAYDSPNIQNDLNVFSNQFNLPTTNADNFEIHKMTTTITTNINWTTETALDVEWAHAIAPQAKILLVEARSALLNDLLAAVDYARNRPDVAAVSMSWGSDEMSTQTQYNYHFTSSYGASFFAASGDEGAGLTWPASSANVIAVGGTTLTLNTDGSVSSETGWAGSGGGVSAYEPRPAYQTTYGFITRRAVPDVAYNANPSTGVSVYTTTLGWSKIGGTSAGSPQWAAIHALNHSATNNNFYRDAKSSSYSIYFRDITLGSNGYSATVGYDYVTGLGSPLTTNFGERSQPTFTNTTITLFPALQTIPLSTTNQFTATYHSNGEERLASLQNGAVTLSVDNNTEVTISGTSSASTEQEKWVFTANANSVTATAGTNLTLYYYNLLSQQVSYTVINGGTPQPPTLTYYTAPSSATSQATPQTGNLLLSQLPQTVWPLRSTNASATNPIINGFSERWITPTATWTIITSNQIPTAITYAHQFLLTTVGTQTGTQWYNNGETAQITLQGVFNRSSGTGQRTTSYALDGGAATQIQPTTGTSQIQILMNAAHQLTINSVNQYQITLDSEASKRLGLITLPTISGDAYWYDQGTTVSVYLQGVTNRQSGTGNRLTSYSINGVANAVSSGTPVSVVDAPLYAPQTISATVIQQYELNTPNGAIKTITAPTITGDAGWYDAATTVNVTYDYSWTQAADQSRLNAVSFTINQGTPTLLNRSGNGTFTVQVTLTEPKTVTIAPISQFHFSFSGSPNSELSLSSPTEDGFFDAGTTITANAPYISNILNGETRQNLISYTLDNETISIARAEEGAFATPAINVDSAHELTFNSVTQYLVSFQFKDHSGTTSFSPTDFQITLDNSSGINLPQFSIWLDNGTRFQISNITWRNVDVQPIAQANYTVDMPLNETINCRVYNVKIELRDYLNLPVSGAQITIMLANQTTFQTTTASDGTADLPMIPAGSFDAKVTYLGITTSVSGDASDQTVVTEKLLVSYSMLGLIAITSIIGVSVVWIFRKRSKNNQTA